MYHFCTYFDLNYLPSGVTLYRSLREHCPEFKLYVLCMDDATHQSLTRLHLPGLEPLSLRVLERDDEPLRHAKETRSQVEYYFTCTPSLPLYILNHYPEVDLITYLDADLFFFASPVPVFEEIGAGSIAIIPHRFPPQLRKREVYGIYNVGWLSFRRDRNGLDCLQWWRQQCIEWCYNRVEDGRFADQKYLDDWPSRFREVVVLTHKGANLAPWNLHNHLVHPTNGGAVMVDGDPLIFYHFHGLKRIRQWLYYPSWGDYNLHPSAFIRRRIYAPYIQNLRSVNHELLAGLGIHPIYRDIRRGTKETHRDPAYKIRRLISWLKDVVTDQFILVLNGYIM
jgi:hypothetical protein